MKRVLITGGAGFIGRSLIDELKDVEIFVLDTFQYDQDMRDFPKNVVKVVWGDVTNDDEWNKFAGNRIDTVIHLAAPSSIILFNHSQNACNDTTILGWLKAVRFCLDHDCKLVYPSTGSLYAGSKPPHSESMELHPEAWNAYADAKYALEYMQQLYSSSIDILGLRIFAGYGPHERHKAVFSSVISLFAQDMIKGKSPVIYGDGSQTRDFIYQTDIAQIIRKLIEQNVTGIQNVGSGTSVSFNEIISTINMFLKNEVTPTYVDKPTNYLESTECDMTTLTRLGLEPQVGIIDGIAAVVVNLIR